MQEKPSFIKSLVAVVAFLISLIFILMIMVYVPPMFKSMNGENWWRLAFYCLCGLFIRGIYKEIGKWRRK